MQTIKRILIIAAALLMSAAAPAQPNTRPAAVIRKVFNGITAAQASAAVPNVGQTMHLLYVIFPGQTTTQSGIEVRLEGSFDNITYVPISATITSAENVGGIVYQIESAFAPWPYVRVNSLQTAPASMVVWYTGHTLPVVSVIQERADRFLL